MWPLCFHLSQLSTYKHGDSQYLLMLPPAGFFSLACYIDAVYNAFEAITVIWQLILLKGVFLL